MTGILLVDKPAGITSHDVVGRTRKALSTRKVGHAGTLDPMATGLLVLGVDSATRLLTFLVGLDKEYTATIRLGQATDTDDAEGDIVAEADAADVTRAEIDAGIAALTGSIEQVPSTFSAIKVDGRRAYDLARAGEEVALKARRVTVSRFELLAERRGEKSIDLDVVVGCTSGTYIRALARDLGAGLGVGGHLTALRRTRVGPFAIEEAAELSEDVDVNRERLEAALRTPADVASTLFPTVVLDDEGRVALTQGKRPKVVGPDAAIAGALTESGRLAGLVAVKDGRARVLVNFPTDEVLA
ncbi:tRNA pseudouridine(55) synthase TruB [soil metagenome]